MSDGNPTPLALDGMSAFRGARRGKVRLVRNSEDRNLPGEGSVGGDPAAKYDPPAGGGTTTLVYDEHRRRLVADYVSLNGTTVNCAGAADFGLRSWISAEETVGGPEHRPPRSSPSATATCSRCRSPAARASSRRASRSAPPVASPTRRSPSTRATGIVYETEDPSSGRGAGFYRYIPDDPSELTVGGRLQMLAVAAPEARHARGPGGRPAAEGALGRHRRADPPYADIDDPRGTFQQGYAKGGALFNRLEGCWEDGGRIFFVSTSGGDAKNGDVNSDGYEEGFGQVWRYRPRARGRHAAAGLRVARRGRVDSPTISRSPRAAA